MDINLIVNTLFEYGSILLAVMAVLVFVTNIIVEVIKGLFPKTPTNIVAVIVALIVTVVALLILCSVLEITIMWYYAVGAVVLGIFVGYAAMFGFDKFKAAWDKIQQFNQ
jgi:hypothetical protein